MKVNKNDLITAIEKVKSGLSRSDNSYRKSKKWII
jgi:hypothetical protein